VRKWCRRCRKHTDQYRSRISEDAGTITTRAVCVACGRKVTTIEKKAQK
jgi:hypothetical protein